MQRRCRALDATPSAEGPARVQQGRRAACPSARPVSGQNSAVISRRRKGSRWASIFADDLVAGCRELFQIYGAAGELSLPISIPIDDQGVVVLRPEGPVDAPRVGA